MDNSDCVDTVIAMNQMTTITVRTGDMEVFRRIAMRLRVPQHRLFGAVVAGFAALTREQQEAALGLSEPASPSADDANQCAKLVASEQAKVQAPHRLHGRKAS